MAESVQYYLESMVPELEDFERKKLFSKDEIREIVKKRTDMEYRLKRRIPKKTDFLTYIQYEMNLESLRKKRKKRLGSQKKSSAIDYSIVRHVFFLFDRALRKFGGDISLWLQYIDYAKKQDSAKQLSKIFGRVIQLHPTKIGFWIMAASWEFENNGNMISARRLMQRAIRMNPESKQLWVEYLKLELMYIEKISFRKQLLLGDNNQDESAPSTDPTPDVSVQADEKLAVLYQVPKAIFKNSLQHFSKDLSFYHDVLEVFDSFSNTIESVEYVYDTIRQQFPQNIDALSFLAERHCQGLGITSDAFPTALKQSLDEYNNLINTIPTAQSMHKMVLFLSGLVVKMSEIDVETDQLRDVLKFKMNEIFEFAESESLMTEDMYILWLNLQGSDETSVVINNTALLRFPGSPQLWLMRVEGLTKKFESMDKVFDIDLIKQVDQFIKKCMDAVDKKELFDICQLYLNWLLSCAEKSHAEDESILPHVLDRFKMVLQTRGIPDNSDFLALVLDWLCNNVSTDKARSFYDEILSSMVPSAPLLQVCIDLETALFSGEKDQVTRLQGLFERSLLVNNQCPDLWLRYAQLYLTAGQADKAEHICWRACQTLPDKDAFIIAYQNLNRF